jgi:hypothetical protein
VSKSRTAEHEERIPYLGGGLAHPCQGMHVERLLSLGRGSPMAAQLGSVKMASLIDTMPGGFAPSHRCQVCTSRLAFGCGRLGPGKVSRLLPLHRSRVRFVAQAAARLGDPSIASGASGRPHTSAWTIAVAFGCSGEGWGLRERAASDGQSASARRESASGSGIGEVR